MSLLLCLVLLDDALLRRFVPRRWTVWLDVDQTSAPVTRFRRVVVLLPAGVLMFASFVTYSSGMSTEVKSFEKRSTMLVSLWTINRLKPIFSMILRVRSLSRLLKQKIEAEVRVGSDLSHLTDEELAQKAEEREIEIYPGFPAAKLLFEKPAVEQ